MPRRSSYDRAGNLRPLRKRNPALFWVAMALAVLMALSGITAVASIFGGGAL